MGGHCFPCIVPAKLTVPPGEHGHGQQLASLTVSAHSGPPISAFQRHIRGNSTALRDHISKEMNELNLERCRCIPKLVPGADWRVLQEIIEQHPERTLYKVPCRECATAHRCSSVAVSPGIVLRILLKNIICCIGRPESLGA